MDLLDALLARHRQSWWFGPARVVVFIALALGFCYAVSFFVAWMMS